MKEIIKLVQVVGKRIKKEGIFIRSHFSRQVVLGYTQKLNVELNSIQCYTRGKHQNVNTLIEALRANTK